MLLYCVKFPDDLRKYTMKCCAVLCLVPQSCPTLYDSMDNSPQAPLSVGILQGKILEWVAIAPPGDLPNPGTEPMSPTWVAGRSFTI